MTVFPYLKETAIEHETLDVLRGFEKKYGTIITPAIPIDEIVENYLGFTLEFNDRLGDDVMGCIDCEKNHIVINTSLGRVDIHNE